MGLRSSILGYSNNFVKMLLKKYKTEIIYLFQPNEFNADKITQTIKSAEMSKIC